MEQGRNNWTDPRIEDLDDRVKCVGERMDAGFSQTNARMDAGFGQVNGRIDAFQRTMMQIGGGVIAALIALVATQL